MAGAVATAQSANVTVMWTSYADRLKEDLVLSQRPPQDEIRFTLRQEGSTSRQTRAAATALSTVPTFSGFTY